MSKHIKFVPHRSLIFNEFLEQSNDDNGYNNDNEIIILNDANKELFIYASPHQHNQRNDNLLCQSFGDEKKIYFLVHFAFIFLFESMNLFFWDRFLRAFISSLICSKDSFLCSAVFLGGIFTQS